MVHADQSMLMCQVVVAVRRLNMLMLCGKVFA